MHIVLIVDDDHDIRVTLREFFEHEGFLVFTAASGDAALNMLKRMDPPSFILLDQNMPIMNGDEFLVIKAKDLDLAHIPVIVMSAVSDRTTQLGAQAFLSKPFDAEQLMELAQKFVRAP